MRFPTSFHISGWIVLGRLFVTLDYLEGGGVGEDEKELPRPVSTVTQAVNLQAVYD